MTIQFYNDWVSQSSRALLIIFQMSDTPFEDIKVSVPKGEFKTEEFRQNVNRFKRIPCIIDGDFKLTESIAVLRYVSGKGLILDRLYPSDIFERARVDEFLEWQHTTLHQTTAWYSVQVRVKPFVTGKNPSDEHVAHLTKQMEVSFDVVENVWLKETEFLCGNKITAADIFAACDIAHLKFAGYDFGTKYPKVRAWMARVREACNPHYDVVHNTFYASLFDITS